MLLSLCIYIHKREGRTVSGRKIGPQTAQGGINSNDSQVSAAGIGGGSYGAGSNIAINGGTSTNPADVGSLAPETEVNPDISELYASGVIRYYAAGTSVSSIRNNTVRPIREVHGEAPDPDDGYDVCDAFVAELNSFINDFLDRIAALRAEGRTEELRALLDKGLLLGADVTLEYSFWGEKYITLIPASTPKLIADLCDEDGKLDIYALREEFEETTRKGAEDV